MSVSAHTDAGISDKVLFHSFEKRQEYGGGYAAVLLLLDRMLHLYQAAFLILKINRLYNDAFNVRMFVRKFVWLENSG